jgi:chemotaxis protein MotB
MNLNNADPLDPVNRRISIIVLNRRAQERIENENVSSAVDTDGRAATAGRTNGITSPPTSTVAPPPGPPVMPSVEKGGLSKR